MHPSNSVLALLLTHTSALFVVAPAEGSQGSTVVLTLAKDIPSDPSTVNLILVGLVDGETYPVKSNIGVPGVGQVTEANVEIPGVDNPGSCVFLSTFALRVCSLTFLTSDYQFLATDIEYVSIASTCIIADDVWFAVVPLATLLIYGVRATLSWLTEYATGNVRELL